MDTIAKILSFLMFPLFMPLYGVILLFNLEIFSFYPAFYMKGTFLTVVLLGILVPIFSLYILWRFGVISDFRVYKREDRVIPYIFTAIAYFFVSFGVACQMIIDGKVLYGQSAAAGEIGHTVVQRNGPVCPTCGNRGCLEALTGERAILRQCRDIMATDTPTILKELCQNSKELTMDQVLMAQSLGDQAVGQVIEDAIEYLGIALANTINLISPRAVVLEGRILSTPKNQETMLRIVEQYMFHIHAGNIDFTFLPFDPDRGAKAAAAVVVKEFLNKSI